MVMKQSYTIETSFLFFSRLYSIFGVHRATKSFQMRLPVVVRKFKEAVLTKHFMNKLLSLPHLPIILLSLARDFCESKKIFSVVYPNVKREGKKFSICINFFSTVEISFCVFDVSLVPKGDFFFFVLSCLNAFHKEKRKCKRDLVL